MEFEAGPRSPINSLINLTMPLAYLRQLNRTVLVTFTLTKFRIFWKTSYLQTWGPRSLGVCPHIIRIVCSLYIGPSNLSAD